MGSMGDAAGEWPLSPARLFSALVAGGGTGAHRRVTGDDSELVALEEAPPPRIVADAYEEVSFVPLEERFVVIDKRAKEGMAQDYPARTNGTVRPGVRLVPHHPELTYVWPDLDLTELQREALRQRAARVGYLGTSDAPAHVTVAEAIDLTGDALSEWVPDPRGTTSVSVPASGFLRALDVAFEQFLEGSYRTGASIPRAVERYRAPSEVVAPETGPNPIFIWMRLDRWIDGHRTVAVAEAAKGLVLSSFGAEGSDDEPPPSLHGHGLPADTDRARFWPLPHVGHHGTGRIHGLCVRLPPDTDPEVVERVRSALAESALRLAGGTERQLTPVDDEPGPKSATPERWSRSSKVWVSASPVVFDRNRKSGPSIDDVSIWCQRAGLPAPAAFEVSRAPLTPGGLSLQPHQTTRKGAGAYPFGHVRLWFDEPISGPFALGRMRSYGLGLMSPEYGTSFSEEQGR